MTPLQLLDRHAPWLLGIAVFAVSMGSVHGQTGVRSSLPTFVLILICACCAVTAALARRWLWPLLAAAAFAYLALTIWPMLFIASYYAGVQLQRNRDLYAFACGVAALLTLSAWLAQWRGGRHEVVVGSSGNLVLMAAAVVALPLLTGLWVRARRGVLQAAREQAERLQREQVMRAEQARTQERARIAREMHDVVAHRVSLMVLHAGALEVSAPDRRTEEAAALIAGIGRESLANLRDVLGVLRSAPKEEILAPQPTLADLDRLLDQSRSLGISVTRHDEGHPRELADNVERAAYRVVQEALTNVHKHARDGVTELFIRFVPGEVEIEVRNARSDTAGEPLPGSGWGLVGLRERIELLGGTLRAGAQQDGGFQVLARIPA